MARTQGGQRFSAEVLTNPSGFAGIDGLFRFRADGTNERGLAVMRACVDDVTLDSLPGRGTVVTLRKRVRWSEDAPLRQLRAAS